jgi:hypothetical protein
MKWQAIAIWMIVCAGAWAQPGMYVSVEPNFFNPDTGTDFLQIQATGLEDHQYQSYGIWFLNLINVGTPEIPEYWCLRWYGKEDEAILKSLDSNGACRVFPFQAPEDYPPRLTGFLAVLLPIGTELPTLGEPLPGGEQCAAGHSLEGLILPEIPEGSPTIFVPVDPEDDCGGEPCYTLTVRVRGEGQVLGQGEVEWYSPTNPLAHLEASPDQGWIFSHWEGAPVSDRESEVITVEVLSNRTVTAVFIPEDTQLPASNWLMLVIICLAIIAIAVRRLPA